MSPPLGHPVVHLELRTTSLVRACAFYTRLFGWRAETVHVGARSYITLGWGHPIEVGVVECDTPPLWLPYVEVADVHDATGRARHLGASAPLGPTEGPAGWRSVIAAPGGPEVGLWQPKP